MDTTTSLPEPRDRSRLGDTLLSSASKRTLFLWVFLLVMFVALWQLFRIPDAGEATPGSPLPALLAMAALPALMLALIGYRTWLAWALRPGNRALQAGDDRAAAEMLERLVPRAFGEMRVMLLAQAGFARFRAGDPARAIALLGQVEQSRGKVAAASAQGVASVLSAALAYRGKLELARGWTAQARKRSPGPGMLRSHLHAVAEAIVASRTGDPGRAAELLDEAWPDLERTLTAAMFRPVRVVRAFCRHQAGLAPLETLTASDLRSSAWTAERWPELAVFLGGSARSD